MEKRNTMLLTVIAVATLLVAVVGATFAYFSLSVSGSAGTTTAQASTEKVPLITLAKGESTFGMTVTAEDMDKTNASSSNKSMWANTSSSSGGSSSGGVWSDAKQNVPIAKLSATDVGAGVTYTCNFTTSITVTSDDEETNMYTALLNESSPHTDDLILHLGFKTGTTGTFTTGSGNLESDGSNGAKIDIAKVSKDSHSESPTSGNVTVTGTIDVSSKNTAGGQEAEVTADLELVNKTNDQQNYLAGKDIKVTLITTASNCQEKKE